MPEISGNGNRKVSTEQIERRAFEIYVQSGMEHGHDLEHWLAAEQELLGEEPRSIHTQQGTLENEIASEASSDSSMVAAFSARR
jgi:hypothetical protein